MVVVIRSVHSADALSWCTMPEPASRKTWSQFFTVQWRTWILENTSLYESQNSMEKIRSEPLFFSVRAAELGLLETRETYMGETDHCRGEIRPLTS